jgi:hypothetical protein
VLERQVLEHLRPEGLQQRVEWEHELEAAAAAVVAGMALFSHHP